MTQSIHFELKLYSGLLCILVCIQSFAEGSIQKMAYFISFLFNFYWEKGAAGYVCGTSSCSQVSFIFCLNWQEGAASYVCFTSSMHTGKLSFKFLIQFDVFVFVDRWRYCSGQAFVYIGFLRQFVQEFFAFFFKDYFFAIIGTGQPFSIGFAEMDLKKLKII